MRIVISNNSGVPIYEQIKRQVKEMILTDEMSPGEILPSIRGLARELRVSVITINRAYSELEQEGYISTMPGKGSYVLPQDTDIIREQYLLRIEEHFQAAIQDALLARVTGEELMAMLKLLLEEEEDV